jgi:hypothetical protein
MRPNVKLENNRAKKAWILQYRMRKSINPTTKRVATSSRVFVLARVVTEIHLRRQGRIPSAKIGTNPQREVERRPSLCPFVAGTLFGLSRAGLVEGCFSIAALGSMQQGAASEQERSTLGLGSKYLYLDLHSDETLEAGVPQRSA